MYGTIAFQQNPDNISTTQTIESGTILEYISFKEKIFEDIPDEFSNLFITRFGFRSQIQPTPKKILKKKEDTKSIDWKTKQVRIIHQAKQWHELHKEKILKDYKGKYIAIILNPQKELNTPLKEAIIGSAKDFHELASKVYKKYGHRTIYMPFVVAKERLFRIPSPRIKIL